MLIQEKRYTVEEFWELCQRPEYADMHLELIEGVLYAMTPTGGLHSLICQLLSVYMSNYVLQHQLGYVTAAETGFILNQGSEESPLVLAPDIAFVAKARMPMPPPKGFFNFAPDLAVEVISPGNTLSEMRRKTESYLRAGTKVVWIVYPEEESITVYYSTEDPRAGSFKFLGMNDVLECEPILLGFSLPLSAFFTFSG
jgi:Uma2 family endonuclease